MTRRRPRRGTITPCRPRSRPARPATMKTPATQKPMKAMVTPVQAAGVCPWLLPAMTCSSLLCRVVRAGRSSSIVPHARACRRGGGSRASRSPLGDGTVGLAGRSCRSGPRRGPGPSTGPRAGRGRRGPRPARPGARGAVAFVAAGHRGPAAGRSAGRAGRRARSSSAAHGRDVGPGGVAERRRRWPRCRRWPGRPARRAPRCRRRRAGRRPRCRRREREQRGDGVAGRPCGRRRRRRARRGRLGRAPPGSAGDVAAAGVSEKGPPADRRPCPRTRSAGWRAGPRPRRARRAAGRAARLRRLGRAAAVLGTGVGQQQSRTPLSPEPRANRHPGFT